MSRDRDFIPVWCKALCALALASTLFFAMLCIMGPL